jgi:shikimate kinase
MKLTKSVALVGLMGAGKTTVGRRLAKWLEMPFADSDEEIEAAARLSVADIFDLHGETAFRDLERRVIQRLAGGEPAIIATGGGAFMQETTRSLLLETCCVIWLRASNETLAERATRRPHSRPLLREQPPLEVMKTLSDRRNPVYALAHHCVDADAATHNDTVDALLDVLAKEFGA